MLLCTGDMGFRLAKNHMISKSGYLGTALPRNFLLAPTFSISRLGEQVFDYRPSKILGDAWTNTGRGF